ncbi:endoglycoceramidase [Nocardioides marmoriginsengisoli]|uniref:Endoglycoceramidase n=1 Tax=Nocardioides marmoriginsengisoli TaxID=661483 RepID=A0A3N0CCX9_9ACTN|nr:cellulase family glycosylhydrolase [Nocardioides marmoriginsengisoli]RNL61268.1 endoglycoceramidase [Nocardioides marmoriginsengisoli]
MRSTHRARLLAAATALLAVVTALTLGSSGNASADPEPVAGPTPQLQRDGRYLVDEKGRLVIVHGLNFVWKKAPYVPPNTPEGFTQADADWLYEHGFNGARLGVLWPGVNPTAPGVVDQSYFDKWDRVVDLMADKGIWMQFDMHQDMWHETYGGEGVPNWAMKRPAPFSLFPVLKAPFPFGYWTPEVSTVYDNFWANKNNLLDHWVTYWKQVADHYKDQPYSMGYDLINEPWAGLEWTSCILLAGCPSTYAKELQPAQNKALAGIRSVDPDNIVWYEPQQLSSGLLLPTHLKAVPGEQNLGLSWHSYCFATFAESTGIPVPLTESCKGFAKNRNNHALAQAAEMNAVPLMTEWGASDNIRALQIDAEAADTNNMGWLYWAYKYWNDPTTADTKQGLFHNDADLADVKADKLKELVRTYPQATAGTDLVYAYDSATGKFTMSYKADPSIDAPTRIFVSPITAPHGYTVTTSTGTVVKNGSYVDLTVGSAGVVKVTITPNP